MIDGQKSSSQQKQSLNLRGNFVLMCDAVAEVCKSEISIRIAKYLNNIPLSKAITMLPVCTDLQERYCSVRKVSVDIQTLLCRKNIAQDNALIVDLMRIPSFLDNDAVQKIQQRVPLVAKFIRQNFLKYKKVLVVVLFNLTNPSPIEDTAILSNMEQIRLILGQFDKNVHMIWIFLEHGGITGSSLMNMVSITNRYTRITAGYTPPADLPKEMSQLFDEYGIQLED